MTGRAGRFAVEGCHGKCRPRFDRRGGRAYTAAADREWETRVRAAWRAAGAVRCEGPVAVAVETWRALPKRTPLRVSSEPDTVKPDADNVAKGVLDALNGLAWADDSQVVSLLAVKHDRARRAGDLVAVSFREVDGA